MSTRRELDRWLDLNRLLAIKWGSTIIDPNEVVYVLRDALTQTDDGSVRSPAAPGAAQDPAAQAGETGWRPAPSSPTTDGGAAAPPGSSPQDAARFTAAPPSVLPRPFLLFRTRDVTGKSGTGVVAWGTLWPDGTVSLRWAGATPSFSNWDSLELLVDVHGHEGATEVLWIHPLPGADDKQRCERCDDEVYTLSTDGLCDGCVAEAASEGEAACVMGEPGCTDPHDDADPTDSEGVSA